MGWRVTVTRGTPAAYAPGAPRMPVLSARSFGQNSDQSEAACEIVIDEAALRRPEESRTLVGRPAAAALRPTDEVLQDLGHGRRNVAGNGTAKS